MWTDALIRQSVDAFPRWHYQFELGGVLTPIHEKSWINRHRQRKRHFFDPLASSGYFAGKRVLDLGCNAGYWSLSAIEAGCEYVLGIDARGMHIDQARLVFAVNEIPAGKYQFLHENIFEYLKNSSDQFDVVFCLGLLYHVCKPMELLEGIARINTGLLLIDSTVLNTGSSTIELRREPLDDPRMAADYELVFLPSPTAIADMVTTLGYGCLPLLPRFDNWEGCADYRGRDRLAFACGKDKHLDLESIYGDAVKGRGGERL
jgi:2-polyprenyl-3-methyl-5-hydroxy-6-metoxy-1,4-benzoquinol methylase